MNNGWRNRFMAPVYALVISFVLVAILGAALNNPLRIQFTIPPAGVSNQHVKELSELSVTLGAAGPGVADSGQPAEERQIGPSLEFIVLNPRKNIRIYAELPTSWVSTEKVKGPDKKTCWEREVTRPVVIDLKDRIRIRFAVPSGLKKHVQELQGFSVGILKAADGRQLAEQQLDSSLLEFAVLNPHEKFQICTTLPPGWSEEHKIHGKRCLERDDTGEDVEIALNRQEN